MPEITLMQVVLPDPFGPTSPSTSPAVRWKDTPSSARNPPKRLTSCSTCNNGVAGASGGTNASARQQGHESVREKQHESHDQCAVDELKILRHGNPDRVVDSV